MLWGISLGNYGLCNWDASGRHRRPATQAHFARSQSGLSRDPIDTAQVNAENRHTRTVEWLLPEVPRSTFGQDLLYSFGAFMTVCNISRNDAVHRVQAILDGKPDPGVTVSLPSGNDLSPGMIQPRLSQTLAQLAHDQIVKQIQSRFVGHDLTRLVDAVLRADGWSYGFPTWS